MNKNTLITIGVLAAVAIGGYYVWKKTRATVPQQQPQASNGNNSNPTAAVINSSADALGKIFDAIGY